MPAESNLPLRQDSQDTCPVTNHAVESTRLSLSQLCELRRKATDISQGYARTFTDRFLSFLFSFFLSLFHFLLPVHRLNGQVSRLINCSCLTTCTVLNEPFMSELLMYFFNSTVGVFSHVCTPKEMSGSAKLLTCLKDGKKLNASWELFDGNFVSNYRRVNTTSQNICVSIIDVRVQPLFLEWSKSNFSCQYHAFKKINQSWHL